MAAKPPLSTCGLRAVRIGPLTKLKNKTMPRRPVTMAGNRRSRGEIVDDACRETIVKRISRPPEGLVAFCLLPLDLVTGFDMRLIVVSRSRDSNEKILNISPFLACAALTFQGRPTDGRRAVSGHQPCQIRLSCCCLMAKQHRARMHCGSALCNRIITSE